MTCTIYIFSLEEILEFKNLFLIIHIKATGIVGKVSFFIYQKVNEIVFHYIFLFYSRKRKSRGTKNEMEWFMFQRQISIWILEQIKPPALVKISPHFWWILFVNLIFQPQGMAPQCDLLKMRGGGGQIGQRAEKAHTSQSWDVKWNEVF